MRTRSFALLLVIHMAAAVRGEETRKSLPDREPWQRTLRTFLGSLTEKDFDLPAESFTQPPDKDDPETHYRHWMLSHLNQPLIGSKRGYPAISAPSRLFTLKTIESEQGVLMPPLWTDPAAYVIQWDYAGNPFHNSRGLKLRTFAALTVLMTMLEDQLETAPEKGGNRFDTLAPSVLTLSFAYPAVKDALTPEAAGAYEHGLRKFARRLLGMDPRGLQPHLVAVGPLAVWTASQALKDEKLAADAERLGKRVWTDPEFLNPAGYSIDRGGMDFGYQGTTNVFATWTALATGWPFAKDAVERAYRLRGFLTLPDPDGKLFGPTHFNVRLGSDIPRDQWEWGVYRDEAAALVTREAAHLSRWPSKEELLNAAATRSRAFQAQVLENGYDPEKMRFAKNEELRSHPWLYRLWPSWSFPLAVNYASVYYPEGAYARRADLETSQSPWLKSPWERQPSFTTSIEKSFTFAKRPGYRAIVHTGKVGSVEAPNPTSTPAAHFDFAGFGGGQLSAFWTPETGSVLLGRRGGVSKDKIFDSLDAWMQWPIHAVSGMTAEGVVVTSARISKPDVQVEGNTVRVSGVVPGRSLGQEKSASGRLDYSRQFEFTDDAVLVETTVKAGNDSSLNELYETIPVFLRETAHQATTEPTKMEFQLGGNWTPADTNPVQGVTAIRLSRFGGAVEIVFSAPQRVKLSPSDWTDSYMSRAACRNVLVDLLPGDARPAKPGEVQIAYRLRAAAKSR